MSSDINLFIFGGILYARQRNNRQGRVRRPKSAPSRCNSQGITQYGRHATKPCLLKGWLTLADLNGIEESHFCMDLQGTGKMPSRDTTFKMPDYEYVHDELAEPHVKLKLLWEEFRKECQASGNQLYMETQFRHYYHKFAQVHKATIRLEHEATLTLEVYSAGTKIAYYDNDLAEISEATLFVAVLPCSQLMYAESFRDEKLPSWIAAHVNAFWYIIGVPKTVVPDNLKSRLSYAHYSGN